MIGRQRLETDAPASPIKRGTVEMHGQRDMTRAHMPTAAHRSEITTPISGRSAGPFKPFSSRGPTLDSSYQDDLVDWVLRGRLSRVEQARAKPEATRR
jgi:hypothetical protein